MYSAFGMKLTESDQTGSKASKDAFTPTAFGEYQTCLVLRFVSFAGVNVISVLLLHLINHHHTSTKETCSMLLDLCY